MRRHLNLIMMSKKSLRQQLITQRKQLSQANQLEKSSLITSQLIQHAIFRQADSIACYLACKGEVNTQAIMQTIWTQGRQCYLPVLTQEQDNTMEFVSYNPKTILERNRYGIVQPTFAESNGILPSQLDLVLLPLVAYDNQGSRLGMGAGFYDRVFAFKQQQSMAKPLLIGLAYDFQQVEKLPCEPWDIQLDGVATESGVRLFSRPAIAG